MEAEIQMFIDDAKDRMIKAVQHFEVEILKIRAGKASPALLNGVMVDYYGNKTPLSQISNVNTTDARTIVIQPWEKKMLDTIERAILAANIGLTPMNNGEMIRLNVPALTEERRKELVKQVRSESEQAKVAVRNIRRETNDEIKRLQKDGTPEDAVKEGEEEVQKQTDLFSKKLDELVIKKEAEIMTV